MSADESRAPPRRRLHRGAAAAGNPTVRDVAETAGVSTASVSRALNAPDSVTGDLRKRVAAAVAALGYVRNGAGRALASRRSGVIGVVTACIGDEEHDRILGAIEQRLRTAGYVVVVTVAGAGDTLAAIRAAQAVSPEALIGVGLPDAEGARDLAERHNAVWVEVACEVGVESPTRFGVDVTRGAETIARYLHGLGHRRFALLTETTGPWMLRVGRSQALQQALAGLPQASVIEAPMRSPGFEEAALAAASLMRQPTPPTAIVCLDDRAAAGAVRGCGSAGAAVPGDVSVVGSGDSDLSRYTVPALTSLRLPLADAGRRAAEAVLGRLSAAALAQVFPKARLIVRGSTGAARVG